MIFVAMVMLAACLGIHATGRQDKPVPDYISEMSNEAYPDPAKPLDDTKPTFFVPRPSPGFFPAPPSTLNFLDEGKVQGPAQSGTQDLLRRRLPRFAAGPQTRRWPEVFRISPDALREMRNSGMRFRPFLRRDFSGSGFRLSYGAAKKRPSYYTEPEGSEFLGGPGK